MALISMSSYSAPKRRPSTYKAKDAAYAVGGNPGYYVASRPKKYPKTSQQKLAGSRAATCGIKKGVSKATVQRGMMCIKYLSQGKDESEAKKLAGVTS